MNMKKMLNSFFKVIVQEAESNPEFSARLEAALGLDDKKNLERSGAKAKETREPKIRRASNRRPPALLDPVQLARRGEAELREELAKLNIEQLRDIVAEYGMDTGKLVLKWRDPKRIIERVIEVARGRAQKGNAFRDQTHGESSTGHPEKPQKTINEQEIASNKTDAELNENSIDSSSSEPIDIAQQGTDGERREK